MSFEEATQFVRDLPKSSDLGNDVKLQFYALYKQATEGDVTGTQPWAAQFEARAKWDAWKKVEGKSKDDAKAAYIALLADATKNLETPFVAK
eukprot:GILI01013177.1.p1 GENE.GILI01013177.1~~GILI01013177.1.p1  ORF type:complete len:105 (-),score=43.04 GILI01013177.1:129-404(-)